MAGTKRKQTGKAGQASKVAKTELAVPMVDLKIRGSPLKMQSSGDGVVVLHTSTKGRVVVVNKPFAKGQLLMTDRAVMRCLQPYRTGPFQALVDSGLLEPWIAAVPAEFERLSADAQATFLLLSHPSRQEMPNWDVWCEAIRSLPGAANKRYSERAEFWTTVLLRFATNCFSTEHNGEDGAEVYDRRSRFSHSCATPMITMSGVDGFARVRARRDIAAGEEVCFSYLDGAAQKWPVRKRRRYLQDGYGFVCHCRRCCDEAGEKYTEAPEVLAFAELVADK